MHGLISYRMADFEDAKFLFDLKNESGTRESSIFTRKPLKWENHLVWLKHALTNNEIALWIVLENALPIGTFRIQRISSGDAEVAIHFIKDKRNNGIGTKVLSDWCRDIGMRWTAKIVDDNSASIALFKKMGFKRGRLKWNIKGISYHNYCLESNLRSEYKSRNLYAMVGTGSGMGSRFSSAGLGNRQP